MARTTFNSIYPAHNHPLDSAAALIFRRVSDHTRERITDLFRHHYSPATALETLKVELQAEYGERYPLISADHSILPELKCVPVSCANHMLIRAPVEVSANFAMVGGGNMLPPIPL